jgi:hypothetical protein
MAPDDIGYEITPNLGEISVDSHSETSPARREARNSANSLSIQSNLGDVDLDFS